MSLYITLLIFETLESAFEHLSWLVSGIEVARQVYLVQLQRKLVFFGIRPDHSDSVFQSVDRSHASFRAAGDSVLEY